MKQHPTGLCSKSSGTMFAVRDDSAVINAFDKAMAKYPDPIGLCSKSSGTMSAVCDDSAAINAFNKAMGKHPV
jgi:phosphoheptose isomerase